MGLPDQHDQINVVEALCRNRRLLTSTPLANVGRSAGAHVSLQITQRGDIYTQPWRAQDPDAVSRGLIYKYHTDWQPRHGRSILRGTTVSLRNMSEALGQ